MATTINGVKLKKTNFNGVKCKRINVNGVKVWTGEEQFTDTSASIYHNHDDWSEYETFTIPISDGDTFRIDSITYTTALSYSETNVQVYVNDSCIKDSYYTREPEEGTDDVTVLIDSDIFTAIGSSALQLKTRGKVTANQHTDNPRVTIHVVYTTGV